MWIHLQQDILEEFIRLGSKMTAKQAMDGGLSISDELVRHLRWADKRREQAGVREHPCPVCGKAVKVREGGRGKQKIFCGSKCRQTHHNQDSPKSWVTFKCEQCGKEITKPKRRNKESVNRFCSRRCSGIYSKKGKSNAGQEGSGKEVGRNPEGSSGPSNPARRK